MDAALDSLGEDGKYITLKLGALRQLRESIATDLH